MPAPTASQLLAKFVANRSEAAFRTIVEQQIDLVHSTAMRQLHGDAHAAQDIAQEVFALLARKAARLPESITLGGWLYRQTCRRCANHVRTESRRRKREARSQMDKATPTGEREADWSEIAPQLDDALLTLSAPDRDAVVLRFLEGHSHRQVGSALGLSEEAARKRTARALEKLRAKLSARGVRTGTAALGAALTTNALTPAPAGAAGAITFTSTANSSLGAVTLSYLPVLLAGTAVGLATSGLIVATGNHEPEPEDPTAAHSSDQLRAVSALLESGTPLWARTVPQRPSIDEVLAELERLGTSGQHSLTDLKREALLDTVSAGDRELIAKLVAERFPSEPNIITPFFVHWSKQEPGRALTTAIELGVSPPARSHFDSLLIKLCKQWIEADSTRAAQWIAVQRSSIAGLDLGFTAGTALAKLRDDHGIERALEFWTTIEDKEAKDKATTALTGGTYHPIVTLEPEEWTAFIRAAGDTEVASELWGKWGQKNPSAANAALQALTDPRERFRSAQGLLLVHSTDGPKIPLGGGRYSVHQERVTDTEQRLSIYIDAAADVGMTRQQALAVLSDDLRWYPEDNPLAVAALETLPQSELDQLRAREAAGDLYFHPGHSDLTPFLFALREIADDRLRNTMTRGGIRRLVALDRDAAEILYASNHLADEANQFLEGLLRAPAP